MSRITMGFVTAALALTAPAWVSAGSITPIPVARNNFKDAFDLNNPEAVNGEPTSIVLLGTGILVAILFQRGRAGGRNAHASRWPPTTLPRPTAKTLWRWLRALIRGLLATAMAGGVPSTVAAGQLAVFALKTDQTFTFENKGNESDLSASLIDVTFEYKLPNGYGPPNTPIDAKLTLVSLVDAKAINNGGDITQTMSLALLGALADKKLNGKNNLMTAGPFELNTVQMQLTGKLNAKQSVYDGPTDHSPKAMSIDSSFFNFNDNYKNLSVEITLKPMNNPLTINANGYLDSFTASGSGIIFGTPVSAVVPEPTSWVLAATGLVMAAALSRCGAFLRRRSLPEAWRRGAKLFRWPRRGEDMRHRVSSLMLTTGAVLALAVAARAIEPRDDKPKPVPYKGPQFIGQVTAIRVELAKAKEEELSCMGTLIGDGVVLTAAHCVSQGLEVRFERFALGGQTFFGLGVRNPLFLATAGTGYDQADNGLVLLLNGPSTPVATLATAQDQVKDGATVKVAGFNAQIAAGPLIGSAVVVNTGGAPANGIFYAYDRTKSDSLLQGGDSGGPAFATFNGVDKVIGVHSFIDVAKKKFDVPVDVDIRVNKFLPFMRGDGQAGKAVLDRLGPVKDVVWTDDDAWRRGSTLTKESPQEANVAILDPTRDPDASTTTVKVRNSPPALAGLLNDVTLRIEEGGYLKVRERPGSGVLNGGVIEVGGGKRTATFDDFFKLENLGMFTIKKNGIATIGQTIGIQRPENAVLNDKGGTIAVDAGGKLEVESYAAAGNAALVNLRGGTVTVAGTADFDRLFNIGRIEVTAGGTLQIRVRTDNNPRGELMVSGGAAGKATAKSGMLFNHGTVFVSLGGKLDSVGYVQSTLADFPNAITVLKGARSTTSTPRASRSS
jgi:hypothetical protein